MKKNLLIYLFAVLICISPISLLGDKSVFTLSYPQDQSTLHETTISVVLDVNLEKVDMIKIITSFTQEKITLKASKTTYCKTISLKLGGNTISVRAYKNDKLVGDETRRVYVSADIYKQFKYPPKNYQKTFFHTDKRESECKSCHDMSLNETPGIAFMDVKESNCFQCHNQLTKDKYAHAPAVNWLCTSCHDGSVGSENEEDKDLSKYTVPEPVNEACFKCHKSNLKLWNSYRYRHEPLDSGRCNKCHNPHSSPYSMFVRKPVDMICVGCHSNRHTADDMDKYEKYKGMDTRKNCVQCHSPHAANQAFFLIEKKKKQKRR